jgi:HK97 gp10 family phage protein
MSYTSGEQDVKDALKRLKKATRAGIRKGTRAGAKIVQATAKRKAPTRSGAMSRCIKVRALPRSRKWIGTTARLVNDGKVFYGGFVNYGTKRQKAQRFLNAAADEVRRSATDEAVRVMRDVIDGAT